MANCVFVLKSAAYLAAPRLKFDTVPLEAMIWRSQPMHVVHWIELSVGRDNDNSARVENVEDHVLER
jgi:hypothetical protein